MLANPDGMSVRVEAFILPLKVVMESLQTGKEAGYPSSAAARTVLEVRGEYFHAGRISGKCRRGRAKPKPRRAFARILQSADAVTLLVDQLIGSAPWWSKIWKAIIARYRDFAATILGDGSVALDC